MPGLSQYLHAYGTDNEEALVNALAVALQNGKGLSCYIHIKKNVSMKFQKLGLSVEAREERQTQPLPVPSPCAKSTL